MLICAHHSGGTDNFGGNDESIHMAAALSRLIKNYTFPPCYGVFMLSCSVATNHLIYDIHGEEIH